MFTFLIIIFVLVVLLFVCLTLTILVMSEERKKWHKELEACREQCNLAVIKIQALKRLEPISRANLYHTIMRDVQEQIDEVKEIIATAEQ